ncbi:MAG TPA: hypothetical protein QGI72_02210 [Poseidonia sp.]|nr:hypothetical protein [Poseidonia sp.]
MEQKAFTEESYNNLVEHPLLLVVIGRPSCDDCMAWREVLSQWAPEGNAHASPEIVHLDLDSTAGQRFCKDHEWTEHINFIPFNVLFQYGEPIDQWPGGTIERLISSLEKGE